MLKNIALIPARSGSKRAKGKNVRGLAGHPLLAYTIAAAQDSGLFDDIVVSSDDEKYLEIARLYGASTPFIRPKTLATDVSPDILWVNHAIESLADQGRKFENFSILRPTSPFRTASTIKRAWRAFTEHPNADTLRAVEVCAQHPGKMWMEHSGTIVPLLPFEVTGQPWHSNQHANLPRILIQNASLEIAKTDVLRKYGRITGCCIVPFYTHSLEGFDINTDLDFKRAEELTSTNINLLPNISKKRDTLSDD